MGRRFNSFDVMNAGLILCTEFVISEVKRGTIAGGKVSGGGMSWVDWCS